jgi:hypothetical protein
VSIPPAACILCGPELHGIRPMPSLMLDASIQ